MKARPIRKFIAVMTLLLYFLPVAAQDITAVDDVDGPSVRAEVFAEELRQSPNVSGVRVLGYVAIPASPGGNPEFFVRVPPGWQGGPVCLRVQTADALYEAAADAVLPLENVGQTVRLHYDTSFSDSFWQARAEGLGEDALAALVSAGACADMRPGHSPALPVINRAAAGAAGAEAARNPVLLLNSFRAEEGFAQAIIGNESHTAPCMPIKSPVRTAYDMRCQIPLPPGIEGRFDVTVWPIKGGELGLSIEVPVWVFP